MKSFVIATLLLLALGLPFSEAQEAEADRSGIFLDIGLGMNYSPVDQKAFLSPQLGLEFSMLEKLMADVGFSFETHSSNFTGIQKLERRYYSIHFLGKYFLLGGLWTGAGFAYSMFLGSHAVNAVPAAPGAIHPDQIKLLLGAGYFSRVIAGIYLSPSLLLRLVLPSEEADSFDFNLGLFFTASLNIKRS